MDSSFASPQSSKNGTSISGTSSSSSASGSDKKKRFANSIAKVFRKSSSSSQEEFSEPLFDEEVDSQLQSELKSLKKVHENLGKQASSLGADLRQTRADAYQLKYQLEDATSRLTPSSSRSEAPTIDYNNNSTLGSASPVAAPASSSPEDAIVAGKKPSKRGKGNIFEEFGFLKNDAVKLVVKGAAGLILLGVLTRLIRGGTNRSKTKARSHHSLQAAPTGAASFVHA